MEHSAPSGTPNGGSEPFNTDVQEETEDGEAIIVGTVGSAAPWFLTGWTNEVKVEFVIDTGCQVTILATSVFEKMCTAHIYHIKSHIYRFDVDVFISAVSFSNISNTFTGLSTLKPVMRINKVLEMTLASLSDENMLLSWSVFQEKSGQISVKIRFEAANDAVNHRDNSHYHRKKPSQIQRDHERAQAWRAKTRNNGKQTQLTQTDISARTPTPPGDVPAQHAGMMTRSKAKVVQLDTPEIQRGDLKHASPTIYLDITLTLADDNALCDVASLISEDTVISGTSADDTSTCLSTHEEVDDGVCDSSEDVMSDDETAIPDNPPPWWNRMMEDMSAEISDMTAKLCVIPKPD